MDRHGLAGPYPDGAGRPPGLSPGRHGAATHRSGSGGYVTEDRVGDAEAIATLVATVARLPLG